jgi:uncharacterized protein (TIGR02996 family)
MTAEAGLLATIWDEPHNDVPRLVYADWLEEHGGEEELARAELIRAQCELTHLPGDDPRFDMLGDRVASIRSRWESAWWQRMPPGCNKGHFDRGFPVPDLGERSLKKLVRQNEKLLKFAPLWRCHDRVSGPDLDVLLPWPFLHRLQMFALRPPLPDGWFNRLASSPNLRNVSELVLLHCDVTQEALHVLLDAWAERSLVFLAGNISSEGVRTLVDHPATAHLRYLKVDGRAFGPDSAKALASGRYPSNLFYLAVFGPFGDTGLAHLLAWPGLCRLRYLSAMGAGLSDDAIASLANAPAVKNLRSLNLGGNQIGEAGAAALADSPYLERLRDLFLHNNPLCQSAGARSRLRSRFGELVRF